MAQGHDILKVFVAKKDGVVLTAGKKLKELKEGEVAIFNADTNLSVADFTTSDKFYLATNKKGKIVKSPNRWIDKDNIKTISIKEPTTSANKKVTFKDFKIFCGKDYSLKIEAFNELTKFEVGVNNHVASLVASSKDCSECGAGDKCTEINPIPVIFEMLRNVNRSKYVTVTAIARAQITGVAGITGTVTKGTALTEAQLKLINTHNLTKSVPTDFVKVNLVFEAKPLPKDNWKEGYLFPRETDFNIVISDSFLGNGVLETTTKTVVEQGSGFDIKHLEFKQINPDSHSRYSNFGREEYHVESIADPNEKYTQISITYGHKTQVTSHLYDHEAEVLLAIPSTTTNVQALKTALKALKATVVGTL